jgi:hypothetical protein
MMAQASWRDRRHFNPPGGPVGVEGLGEEAGVLGDHPARSQDDPSLVG